MASKNKRLTSMFIALMERRLLPDSVIRVGIRRLLAARIQDSRSAYDPDPEAYMKRFVSDLTSSSLAEHTEEANEQHYEVPSAFFLKILGPRLKYSSCLWEKPGTTLAQAEEAMLSLTCERAELKDGLDILELGCGWGSLSLWMAEHYPNSSITAVSKSRTQREHIEGVAAERGLKNLRVITCDINHFQHDGRADRIVSVEMFEHVRNYPALFQACRSWLKPEGKMFIHVFAHRDVPYLFETESNANWMAKYFFTGGTMSSHDLFRRVQDAFEVEEDWVVNGEHYSRTLEAWLVLIDQNEEEILSLFQDHYGREAKRWVQRWRIFMIACSELFLYRDGTEWAVSHYRMRPKL